MDLSPNIKTEREISVKSAVVIIGITIIGVIIVGLTIGYTFFWNKFDTRTKIDRDLERIEQTVKARPKDARAHVALGNQLLARGDKKEALKEFKKAYELDKKDEVARFALGFGYRETGEYDKAIKMLEPLIKDRPFYFLAQYNLGVAYFQTKQYDKAVKAYKMAIHVESGAADVYLELAKAYAALGKKKDALESVNQALKFVPDYQEALDFKKSLNE